MNQKQKTRNTNAAYYCMHRIDFTLSGLTIQVRINEDINIFKGSNIQPKVRLFLFYLDSFWHSGSSSSKSNLVMFIGPMLTAGFNSQIRCLTLERTINFQGIKF